MKGQLNSAMAAVPKPEKATGEIDYVRWLQQMQTDLAETMGGVLLRGARPVQVGTADSATSRVSTSPGRVVGWSIRETVGTDPAVIRLWDGRDNEGLLVACINLGSGQSTTQWMAPGGVSFQEGLFCEVITGAGLSNQVEGAVYLGAAE